MSIKLLSLPEYRRLNNASTSYLFTYIELSGSGYTYSDQEAPNPSLVDPKGATFVKLRYVATSAWT